MSYLKINLRIAIEYLFNGNSSSPDIGSNLNISSKISEHHHSKLTTKINSATNICGPHRTQSVDQTASSPFLQNYEKNRISLKKQSLTQSHSQGKSKIIKLK